MLATAGIVYGIIILSVAIAIIIYNGNDTDHSNDTNNTINCDESISGTVAATETSVLIKFTNPKTQNVLFTNCGSKWTNINNGFYLKNSEGLYIHDQHANYDVDHYCSEVTYATYCYNETEIVVDSQSGNIHCDWNTTEVHLVIADLPKDDYTIEIRKAKHSEPLNFTVNVYCDPILCGYDIINGIYADIDNNNDYDSTTTNFYYQCTYTMDTYDDLRWEFCNLVGDLNYMTVDLTEVQSVRDIYLTLTELGLGIQNNIMLMSLLFVNVSTAIFVIIGINQLPLDIDTGALTSAIATTQLLLTTSFLAFDRYQFGSCYLKLGNLITTYGYDWWILYVPTPFHFIVMLLSTLICLFWAKFVPSDKCCSACSWFKYFCIVIMFILAIWSYYVWFPWKEAISEYDSDVNYYGLNIAWDDMLPDLIPLFLFFFLQSLLPLTLMKLTNRFECLSARRFLECVLVSIIANAVLVGALSAFSASLEFFEFYGGSLGFLGSCEIVGGGSWLNPVFLVSSFTLLFSEFRILAMLQNVALLLIVFAKYSTNSQWFCKSVVNVQYLIHSFLIPIYIMLLFRSIPQLRPLASSLVGIYLVAVDIYSDMVVVFFFINETEYIFAGLQILVIITGQVVGAITDVFEGGNDKFTTTDKVMAGLGFGRIWFTMKWWNEKITTEDDNGKFKILRQKHKIWDLLFEAFPTVALQIYASMTTNVSLTALAASIIISSVSASFSTIRYLGALLRVTPTATSSGRGQDIAVPTSTAFESSMITSPKRNAPRKEAKSLYLALFVFMFSDFYIRSIPVIMLLATISIEYFGGEDIEDFVGRVVTGSFLYGMLIIFECVANQKMRIPSHRGSTFILKFFAASVFSSFYTMLCTLNVLKTDPYFAKSVIFSKYLVEHKIRCGVALVFCICSIALSYDSLHYPWILSVLFVLCLGINGPAMKWIYDSEIWCGSDSEVLSQQQCVQEPEFQSIELQTVERIESETVATQDGYAGYGVGTSVDNGKDIDDGAVRLNPVDNGQDAREETVETDTDLEINDIYDMITDVLDENNGPDPNEIMERTE